MKGGRQPERAGADAKPGGVRTEEATLTISGADWEASPQGPLFKVAEGPPDRAGSPQRIRRGKPDGETTSTE